MSQDSPQDPQKPETPLGSAFSSSPDSRLKAGSLRSRQSTQEARSRAWVPWLLGLVALVGIGLTVATQMLAPSGPELTLEGEGRIAILPIKNEGPRSDDWVGWGLAAVISEGLEATDGVRVLAPTHFFRVLADRGLDAGVTADRERAHTLAVALGAETVADITLRRSGKNKSVSMNVLLTDAQGSLVSEVELTGEDPMAAAGLLVTALADALGGGRAPVPLAQALSADVFVDRLYAEGLDRLLRDSAKVALPYFEIALSHHPDFVHAKLRWIECLRRTGRATEAEPVAQELLSQAQSRGSRALQAEAFRALGILYALRGNTVAADEQYKHSLRLDQRRKDPRGEAIAHYERARLALADGRSEDAESLFQESLKKKREDGDQLGQIDLLVRLGSLFLTSDRLEDAENLLNQALLASTELDDVWNEHRVLASLGEVAWRQGRSDDAVELWGRALSFYQQQEDGQRIMLLSRNLARALIESGDYGAAESRYRDQLEYAQNLEDPRLEAEAVVRLAWLQLRQGYPFQARPLVQRAVELDRYLTDRTDLQRVIAWMAYEEGDYALAMKTQGDLRRQSADVWTEQDEAFLMVYGQARVQRRRLPLPGERGEPGA